MYARLKVPTVLKQWVALGTGLESGQKLLVPLYEVIRGNVGKLYSGMKIKGMSIVRITRDADVELEDDETIGIRELVLEQVRQRRYEPVVRLEFGPGADPEIKEILRKRFELSTDDLYDMPEEVDYTTLFELLGLPLPALHDAPWSSVTAVSSSRHPCGPVRHDPGWRHPRPSSLRELRRQRRAFHQLRRRRPADRVRSR